jgi:hypothetical protein
LSREQEENEAGKQDQRNTLKKIYGDIFDWPRFDSLRNQPELRLAAQAAFPGSLNWKTQFSKSRINRADLSIFRRELLREIEGLQIKQMSGAFERRTIGLLVLAVEGLWTLIGKPGVICCSHAVLSDKARIVSTIEQASFWSVEGNEDSKRHRSESSIVRLPPSIIQPFTLWSGTDFNLSCQQIIPYLDGFEIEIRLEPEADFVAQPATLTSSQTVGPQGQVNQFAGLTLEINYADGRTGSMSELAQTDGSHGAIRITRFWRDLNREKTQWLWVSPLPPNGDVNLRFQWESRGMSQIHTRFDSNQFTTESS